MYDLPQLNEWLSQSEYIIDQSDNINPDNAEQVTHTHTGDKPSSHTRTQWCCGVEHHVHTEDTLYISFITLKTIF